MLFIGSYPPPYGGIASHLVELLPELAKRGYTVMSFTPSASDKTISSAGMKHIFLNLKKYALNHPFILSRYLTLRQYQKELGFQELLKTIVFAHAVREIIETEEIDAVFIYTIDYGWIVPVLKRMLKKKHPPILLMIFGAFYLWPEKYLTKMGYVNEILSGCDVLLSSSGYCAASVSSVLGLEHPVRVIYVGVDESVYTPDQRDHSIRKALGLPDDGIVLLFLGRMTVEMGLDLLIRIHQRILGLHEKVYLILAGAEDVLSPQAKALSQSEARIRYCPNISFLEKPSYYNACDILIAPSSDNYACMGVTIKEAMASGKPVLATRSGGIPEAVVDGTNGFLVPVVDGKADEDLFLDRLSRLIDPVSRIQMGENGRRMVIEKFTNDQTVHKYLNLVEELERRP